MKPIDGLTDDMFCVICDILRFVPTTVKSIVKYEDNVCVVIESINNIYVVYFNHHRYPRDWEMEHMIERCHKLFDLSEYVLHFPDTGYNHFFFYVKRFGE